MKRTRFQKCVRLFAGVVIAAAALFSTVRIALACPTCAEAAAANDPEHEHMVKGVLLQHSIYDGACRTWCSLALPATCIGK